VGPAPCIDGHPVHHSFLRELAEEIHKPRGVDSPEIPIKLGKHWVSRFLVRNPILQSKLAKNIEAARKEVTKAQLENWFDEFRCVVAEYGIKPEHIYNMDETGTESPWIFIMLTGLGFNIGKRGRNAYVICSGAEPRRIEWVTVLECICGDGSKISPLVIFKGESIQTSWIPSESEMNGD